MTVLRARLRHMAALFIIPLLTLAALAGCAPSATSHSLTPANAPANAPQQAPTCATPSAAATSLSSQALAPSGAPLGSAFTVTVSPTQICAYPTDAGAGVALMYPVVDAQGMVWSGKMVANTLVQLNPRTGVLREWVIPGGRGGVMDTLIDANGAVWFTESAANFIGRFDPSTERFTNFPVPDTSHLNTEPERLWLDSHGALWFTAHQSMGIGRLDPATGAIRAWPVPRLAVADGVAHPFSIAVTETGEVWFGAAERGGALGRLDPATGAVRLYPLPACDGWPQDIVALAPDPAGRIWFVEHQYACMGFIETATGQVTEWRTPAPPSLTPDREARALNALVRDPSTGALWMTSTGANALLRYMPTTRTYTYYPLPIPQSIPFGVTRDSQGKLWFTADGGPGVTYIGSLKP
jgi:virginiamycin B lyase